MTKKDFEELPRSKRAVRWVKPSPELMAFDVLGSDEPWEGLTTPCIVVGHSTKNQTIRDHLLTYIVPVANIRRHRIYPDDDWQTLETGLQTKNFHILSFEAQGFTTTASSSHQLMADTWAAKLGETLLAETTESVRTAADEFDAVAVQILEENPSLKAAAAALEEALQNASDRVAQTLREAYLDCLEGLPDVPESRLALLNRAAKKRRHLAKTCDLVEFKTFAKLAAGQIDTQSSNLPRVFSRLREKEAILCVEFLGKSMYPAIQLDSKNLKIFDEIPPLLMDAHAEGYTDWDILDWLASEQYLEDERVDSGRPLDHATPKELLKKLKPLTRVEKAGRAKEPSWVPVELLQSRQLELFQQLRKQWLRT